MADLTLRERLQPSLLDRLTDREPETNRESRDRRVLSEDRLRESVIRDLGWLLNTANLAASEDLSEYPEIESSVLNYGAPDLAGVSLSSTNVEELEKALRTAITTFEPRISADKLRIHVERNVNEANHNALSFRIEGELWAQPMPLSLFLKTEVDLETGTYSVKESSRHR
jgi:type VI secretion system protein ImpF